MKKFYNREKEIAQLKKIEHLSKTSAQMTFVIGRRRIGKTALLKQAYNTGTVLYFFVERKNEALLCEEFLSEIRNKLHVNIHGEMRTFKSVFGFLMDFSKTNEITIIIDEFQEFRSVNPSIFSEMQNIWDNNKDMSKINLVLCGSIFSMMKKIFENSKEPLFGRATSRIHVKSFDIATLKEIFTDYKKDFSHEDLFAFYLFTGGVAKYVEILTQANAFSLTQIADEIFTENSLFLDEGKNVLIDEFGKDYGNYFSILSLIAGSKTSRSEIESVLNMNIGGFLGNLENDFGLIEKNRPLFSKPGSKNVKYNIKDNFLNFWFRFIFKYRSAVENHSFEFLKDVFYRDYKVFSGLVLEKYFKEKISSEMKISQIGSYWENGNSNEIDIVAINEFDKTALIAEVKRNKEKLNMKVLKEKSKNLMHNLRGYEITYKCFSLEDV